MVQTGAWSHRRVLLVLMCFSATANSAMSCMDCRIQAFLMVFRVAHKHSLAQAWDPVFVYRKEGDIFAARRRAGAEWAALTELGFAADEWCVGGQLWIKSRRPSPPVPVLSSAALQGRLCQVQVFLRILPLGCLQPPGCRCSEAMDLPEEQRVQHCWCNVRPSALL